jgi:hypothetical protein
VRVYVCMYVYGCVRACVSVGGEGAVGGTGVYQSCELFLFIVALSCADTLRLHIFARICCLHVLIVCVLYIVCTNLYF